MNKQLSPRFPTPFAAFAEQRRLDCLIKDEGLVAAYASSDIQILPYQIAAAQFALRSRYLKGCILCDEGSLGKTYEALLIVAQRWHERKGKILIVLPDNLIDQWYQKIKEEFNLFVYLWHDRKKAEEEPMWDINTETVEEFTERKNNQGAGLFLISYDEAINHADEIEKTIWDIVVFDEADCLFKPENKTVITLKKAVGNAFKLLLTPTPITNSIMDIYGLIHFIDESVLPDAKEFYRRYHRKPENYPELAAWVSRFAFRTLKKQIAGYVNFTNRLPIVVSYMLSEAEKKLYDLIQKYLELPRRDAYPEMDVWRLSLLFYHTVSSSAQALADMLNAPLKRVEGAEHEILKAMQTADRTIQGNSKTVKLIETLTPVFDQLKKQKENQKALVFIENLATLEMLSDALKTAGYGVLTYKDEKALERFRNDETIQILICNDAMAKGLDIEYCPVVVNYDLLYNAVQMEQRICRCHRQGQQSDVLVINLISQENMADVRIVELLRKRVLQFDGIFGLSDAIMDNFDVSIKDMLKQRRAQKDIQGSFETNRQEHRSENEEIVSEAENTLFTTFTKKVSDKIKITPKYIEEKSAELDEALWNITAHYFETEFAGKYMIDEETKTISLNPDEKPPHLFYYQVGEQDKQRHKPYTSLKKYGSGKNVPLAYRITPSSILISGILYNSCCKPKGEIVVDDDIEPCTISFYNAELVSKNGFQRNYNLLVGKTKSGQILDDTQCRKILAMPVKSYSESGREMTYLFDSSSNSYFVNEIEDPHLRTQLRERYIKEAKTYLNEDITLINLKTAFQKAQLGKELAILKNKISPLKEQLNNGISDPMEELKAKKQLTQTENEIKKQEEGLFLEQMRIEAEAEKKIEELKDTDNLRVDMYRLFHVQVWGKDGPDSVYSEENQTGQISFL